jgi:alanine racemase
MKKMNDEIHRGAWVEVNLANLSENIKQIKGLLKPAQEVMGIIKADAYGHGALRVAQTLQKNGLSYFGVATIKEAIDLRDGGIMDRIMLLGLTQSKDWSPILDYDLVSVTCDLENAQVLSDLAQVAQRQAKVFLAIDTGMGRIGYLVEEAEDRRRAISEITEIMKMPGLEIQGLFSHMSTADAKDKTFSHRQERLFLDFEDACSKAGITFPLRTLANSASTMELSSVHYDIVRPGIILYGCMPSEEVPLEIINLKPVMSVKANILQLKDVGPGFSVGYGRKFVTERPSRIATLPLGYADGLPRPYSQVGKVIVGGEFAPLAGNICMDQCMIDVTDIKDVAVGDEVVVLGSQGDKSITAQDIGWATGTINYEIVCAFGQRLSKVYLD